MGDPEEHKDEDLSAPKEAEAPKEADATIVKEDDPQPHTEDPKVA